MHAKAQPRSLLRQLRQPCPYSHLALTPLAELCFRVRTTQGLHALSAGSKRSSAEAADGAEGELQKKPRLDNGAAAPVDGGGPAPLDGGETPGQEEEGAESAAAAQGGSVESSRAMASGEVMEAEAAVMASGEAMEAEAAAMASGDVMEAEAAVKVMVKPG